jgi:hypothetical protein
VKRIILATTLVLAIGIGTPAAASAAPNPAQDARTVHTEADLARVSLAARKLIQTVVSEDHERRRVRLTGAKLDGWQDVGAGCWDVWDTWNGRNVWGWVLVSATTRVNNYCNNGAGTITSTPWAQYIANTHWGWSFCGLTNQYAGWFAYPWEWGAGASFGFDPGPCAPWRQVTLSPEVHVYGNGTWWGS